MLVYRKNKKSEESLCELQETIMRNNLCIIVVPDG